MKKVLLGIVLMLSLFSCGNKTDDKAENNDKQVLNFVAYQGGYGVEVWKDIVSLYEKENPNVKVNLTISKTIEDELTSKIKGGEYPDVAMIAMGRKAGLTENFVKEQALEDLSDVLNMKNPNEDLTVGEKIEPAFIKNAVTQPYGDGKTYLMPTFYSTTGLFYNKTLFEKEGFEVPKTWDEFFALGEKAKAKGISLFTYPTAGYLDTFIPSVLASIGGYDAVNKFFNFDSEVFKSEVGTKFFGLMDKILANVEPTTVSNGNAQNLKKNQQLVIDGKALFMPNGFWVVNEMAETTPKDMQWGMMALPSFEGKDRYAFSFFEQIWVPKEAKNKEEAKKFIAFLYSDKAAEVFAKYNAVQPIKNFPYDKLTEQNQLFFNIYKEGAKPVVGGFVPTKPVEGIDIKKDIFFAVDSVVNKTKTITDWKDSLIKIFTTLHENIIK